MTQMIISYRKSLVKTGSPGVLKVGHSEINFESLSIKGKVNAIMNFNPNYKSRHGTTMPLIIQIIHDGQILENGSAERKRMLARKKYQEEHPNIKGTRKPVIL